MADRLLAHVPLWAQRSSSEVNLAKRQSLELAMRLGDRRGDLSEFMMRFALDRCLDARSALTFFQLLREAERQGGQLYSQEDISASEESCLAALAKRRRTQVQRLKADGSSDEGAWEVSDIECHSGEEAPEKEAPLKVTPQLLADLGVEPSKEELDMDQWYPSHLWDENSHILPGHRGFNQRATKVLRRAGVCQPPVPQQSSGCRPLQPHQEIVRLLVHPKSPVQRLLVDHPTGSGKTREMICVLENFFYDQRPKIAIFPKAAICRNFYTELLRWPNRYRDYFSCLRPREASLAAGAQMRREMWDLTRLPERTVRELIRSLREVLEMKGQSFRGFMRKSFRDLFKAQHPGEPMPLAPLIAISYASAGGSYVAMNNGQPVSAVMKIAWHGARPGSAVSAGSGAVSDNVLDHKILLLDEVHQLLHPGRYSCQLQQLRRHLAAAQGSVVVGFSGTLVLDQPEEGRQLLEIVKGAETVLCDEGFLSSFPTRPREFFAEALPKGVPDELGEQIQKKLVHRISLSGASLNAYDLKIEKGVDDKRLAAYCNVCSFVSSFHDGAGGSKNRILACPEECCPKLWAVAQAVANSQQKALVMTSRACGYLVMLALLRQMAEKSTKSKSAVAFQVATMEELAEFNHVSNAAGQVFRVLVANANECAEGISFLAVRHVHLTEVPLSQGRFLQICGRALRMFGHESLPKDQQTVTYHLYVATLPSWMSSSLASWAFRAQPRRRYKSGHAAELGAREMLAKLESKGIRSLKDLRMRSSGFEKAQSTDENLMKWLSEQEILPNEEKCQTVAMQRAVGNGSATLLVETWDELALRQLAESASRMGLGELRQMAVDAQILQDLSGYQSCSQVEHIPRRRLRCKTPVAMLSVAQGSISSPGAASRSAAKESDQSKRSKRVRTSVQA